MVLGALVRLFAGAGQKPVSRWALVRSVSLPETTVDDRLRVLLARGNLVRHGKRGQYSYAPIAGMRMAGPVQQKEMPKEKLAVPVHKPQPQQIRPDVASLARPELGNGFYYLRPGIDF